MLQLASIYPHCCGSFSLSALLVQDTTLNFHCEQYPQCLCELCVTEQNSLRHKASHWATFTFLKRMGLCIKFCLHPCTGHEPYEQTPALFPRAPQPQAHLRSTSHPLAHQSHSLLFPSISFPLPCSHLIFAGSQNDAPGEGILCDKACESPWQRAVPPTPSGAPVLPACWTRAGCSTRTGLSLSEF